MDFQYSNPVPYEDLTPAQRQEICNGCGGKGGIVKPPHRIFFRTSCNHHDYGYWKGCTEADRKAADQMLRKKMNEDVATLPWLKRIRYRPWCWVYYMAVRAAGGRFFHYADKKRYPIIITQEERSAA